LKYLLFNSSHPKKFSRIDLEEFKMCYEKEYEAVKNLMQDDVSHAQFIELKNTVGDYVRKI